MSECQTFPRLEKKSGAFCFLRSEKRPVKQTGSPMGTDPRNGNLSSGIPVRCFFCRSLPGMVRLAGVLRSWIWQLRMLIGATPLLSFPWRCCRR